MDLLRQQAVECGSLQYYISPEDLGITLVATVETKSVKFKAQDERGVPEYWKQLILLNL